MMVSGQCHCGAVAFELKEVPAWLTDCNCSICRRLGALWAHAAIADINILSAENATLAYVHGDKMLAMHSCRSCGCTTHWESLTPDQEGTHMAVNFRMVDPSITTGLRVRHFDGAESWEYLD